MKQGPSAETVSVFESQLALWGITLGDRESEILGAYAAELASYERANVVGTRDIERLWLDHVLDSLSCLLYEPLQRASRMVDVGSGGGMPGVPLHLAVGFTGTCLVEATGKKAEFLRHVSRRLSLAGVEVANYRAEELAHKPGYRESFDAATVRAVAPLDVISEYCLPFVAPGGFMIAMKGHMEPEERRAGERAADILGAELEAVLQVPFTPGMESKERHLVVLRKVRPTPSSYPRKPGTPRKSPLGV